MQKRVWVTASFVGFHRWQDAPDEVAFLRDYHRHKFLVKVTVAVTEARGVEFFMLQADVIKALRRWDGQRFESSCEEVAEVLLSSLLHDYGYDIREVEVSEDGECGGVMRRSVP